MEEYYGSFRELLTVEVRRYGIRRLIWHKLKAHGQQTG
jgi:hypothetical protein